ncbi:unnamed protein product [Soboliphyme baturini]|uniref:Cytotoxic and regulatory T-cell molecule n=1 Tax=Soboliphyme baturini TaxID=241478 RepID=A0A183ILM0_9BILA|nr:unnamed protein product [Soboliphyme baturini]
MILERKVVVDNRDEISTRLVTENSSSSSTSHLLDGKEVVMGKSISHATAASFSLSQGLWHIRRFEVPFKLNPSKRSPRLTHININPARRDHARSNKRSATAGFEAGLQDRDEQPKNYSFWRRLFRSNSSTLRSPPTIEQDGSTDGSLKEPPTDFPLDVPDEEMPHDDPHRLRNELKELEKKKLSSDNSPDKVDVFIYGILGGAIIMLLSLLAVKLVTKTVRNHRNFIQSKKQKTEVWNYPGPPSFSESDKDLSQISCSQHSVDESMKSSTTPQSSSLESLPSGPKDENQTSTQESKSSTEGSPAAADQ